MAKQRKRFKQHFGKAASRRSVARALWLVGALATAFAAYLVWVATLRLDPGAETYVVEPGTSLHAFTRQLARQGLLPDRYSLVWLARLKGQSRGLKAGEYRFRKGITPLELLEQVVAGRVVEYPFLIVEGWNFRQVLAALDAAPKLTRTLQGQTPKQVMQRLGFPDVHPEGRFYPDTYYYSRGMTDATLLQSAFKKMETLLEQEWGGRDPTVPLKRPEDALILASIVEKETGQADERPLIAGVFVNRLRIGMRLQTDPTVIYGMGDAYKGNIRLQDLRHSSPYNTYIIRGLPPTPIAMPGIDAIRAVLHPAPTRALYFVSRGDGSHIFSETLKEHNEAVIKYQLNGRRKTTSSYTAQPVAAPARPKK